MYSLRESTGKASWALACQLKMRDNAGMGIPSSMTFYEGDYINDRDREAHNSHFP